MVVVGAGFAGMYMLHRLRAARVCRPRARGRRRRRRHLVLEPLSRRALRRREHGVLLLVLRRAAAGVGLDRALRRPSPRSCATPATSPTGSTCAATSGSTRGSTAATFDDDRRPLDGRAPTTATRLDARFLVMATGCLSAPNLPDIAGRDRFAGADATTPAAGPTRASTSPASGSASSARARRRSSRSRSSPSRRRSCTSSSARRTTRCPRTTGRSTPRPCATSRRTTPGSATRSARRPRSASSPEPISSRRSRRRDEERRARVRGALGSEGGLGFLGAFSDLLIDQEANATAAEFVRAQDPRDRARTPRWPSAVARHDHRRASACASTPATTRPSTAPTSRWSTCGETPIVRDHAGRRAHAPRAALRARRDRVRDRFDAMTGALLRIDIQRPRRRDAARHVGDGPRTYLGLRDRRLPEPVHRSPGRAARRC